MNDKKKQLGYIDNFFELKFDTLLMKAWLQKDKLEKAIKRVARIIEKKSSTTHKELQFLVGLFSYAAKIIYLGRAFFQQLYNRLAKIGKYLHWLISIKDDLL